jgi:hypothetical protein
MKIHNNKLTLVKIFAAIVAIIFLASCEKQATLEVGTNAKGAMIYINGEKKATTGEGLLTLPIPAGDYNIKAIQPIDENWEYMAEETGFTSEKTIKKIFLTLKKKFIGDEIVLRLSAQLKDIPIFLNDKKIGLTKEGAVDITLKKGTHLIKLLRKNEVWKVEGEKEITVDSEIDQRYEMRNDKIIVEIGLNPTYIGPNSIDPDEGLLWYKPEPKKMNWPDANKYCHDLKYVGLSDWRLPTFHERKKYLRGGNGNDETSPDIWTRTTSNAMRPLIERNEEFDKNSYIKNYSRTLKFAVLTGPISWDYKDQHKLVRTRCVTGNYGQYIY